MATPAPRLWLDLRRFAGAYLMYFLPVGFLAYLTLESYQIDFRSFYLAGKSVVLGLDPYLNYVGLRPEFYGPMNSETAPFSGFRYPPLAALAFAPLGALSYPVAKGVFTLAMVLLLGLISFSMVRRSQFTLPGEALLFMLVSFPVLATVERGQVDSLVLYLTLLAYWGGGRRPVLSALALALASLLKLFPILVVLFYGWRRQWGMVLSTLAWLGGLLALPYLHFGPTVYWHFLQRTLPAQLGQIATDLPLQLHGQGIALGKVVQSIDAPDLLVSHDFVNGYMNPLLSSHTGGAVVAGAIATVILLWATRKSPRDLQFYAFLTVINLYNPVAWIMGLVWYLPLFLYLYPSLRKGSQMLILLPLFLPPFLNSNAILAYLIALTLAITYRLPDLQRALMRPPLPVEHLG
jgi:hypothetical protein